MIETISLNARDINLCINAESQTLPEERRPWLYVSKRLSALKKKYYLESEGFIFFDEGRAISIAAQIVKWIHTDIQAGRHYILLPFDNIVYVAAIRVQTDYILVEKEDLLAFEDCLDLIRSNPLECQVAELGRLSDAFLQHNISLKDLYINLDTGKNNPFQLKRGYNLWELSLLGLIPCISACLVVLLISNTDVREMKETTQRTVRAEPRSTIRIATDLEAVGALLNEFSVLLAYELDTISIKKSSEGYLTSATGRYVQSFSLDRLNRIADALDGAFSVQTTNWTLHSSLFKPPPGEDTDLTPLATSFERYRQFAEANHARFSIIGSSRKRDTAKGIIELSFDYPNRTALRVWVRQLQQTIVHGYLQQAGIATDRHSGWRNLTITIEIIGT